MSSATEDSDVSSATGSSSGSSSFVVDTMNKKFVIVGGGNYIGFHIAKGLNARGVFVLLVDSVEPSPEWGRCDMPFRKTNIFDRKELVRAFERAHCVIHTGENGLFTCCLSSKHFSYANNCFQLLLNSLESCRTVQIRIKWRWRL